MLGNISGERNCRWRNRRLWHGWNGWVVSVSITTALQQPVYNCRFYRRITSWVDTVNKHIEADDFDKCVIMEHIDYSDDIERPDTDYYDHQSPGNHHHVEIVLYNGDWFHWIWFQSPIPLAVRNSIICSLSQISKKLQLLNWSVSLYPGSPKFIQFSIVQKISTYLS